MGLFDFFKSDEEKGGPKSGKDSMDVLEQQLNQLTLMTVLCFE